MLKTLNVGIDISHDRHAVCLLDTEGKPIGKPFSIPNNVPGVQELLLRIRQAAGGYDRVLVGLEATGIYWWHLCHYLRYKADISPQLQVVAFNPNLIDGFRKAYRSVEKTDPRDAFLIAERLRFGHLPDYPPPDPAYFPLQRLTRYRFHLIHTLVRTKTYALTLLFLAASDYERLRPFSDPFGATSMAVLTEYHTLGEMAQVPLEQLVSLFATRSRHRINDPEILANRLKQIAADSFQLDEDAIEPVHFALSAALAHIRFLAQQLKSLDKRIAKELQRFPNTLLSIPGMGSVCAAGIIAEIGDVHHFDDDDAVARFAGLWWPRHQTGGFEAQDRSLSKAGNAYLRYYLCEAANSLRVHNEEYRLFYERKYRETPKHQHKRGCVLAARKLVRLVYALLSKNQIYAGSAAKSPKNQTRRL